MASVPLTVTAGSLLGSNNGWFKGYNLRETSGSAPASVKIYNGYSTNGQLIATIGLLAGTSVDIHYPILEAINFQNGMFVVITGAVEGTIRWSK